MLCSQNLQWWWCLVTTGWDCNKRVPILNSVNAGDSLTVSVWSLVRKTWLEVCEINEDFRGRGTHELTSQWWAGAGEGEAVKNTPCVEEQRAGGPEGRPVRRLGSDNDPLLDKTLASLFWAFFLNRPRPRP